MKKLGIIGGIGPEATINYYLDVIKQTQQILGTDKQLPEIVINSINMYHMFDLLEQKNYSAVVSYLAKAADQLRAALKICTKSAVEAASPFGDQIYFFSQPFIDAGIKIILPSPSERTWLHQKIVDELENGVIIPVSKQKILQMAQTGNYRKSGRWAYFGMYGVTANYPTRL